MIDDGRRYILISPVRNEERYLPATIASIVAQAEKPREYILVDDGSSDKTPAIIKEACSRHPWIQYLRRKDRGERRVGPGVVEAFYAGHNAIKTADYEYLCKVDGDLTFGSRYFSHLMDKFEHDPHLGAASGKLFLKLDDGSTVEERIHDESVLGGALFLKRDCFEKAGGFVKEVMWDGILFHRARMAGYRTHSFTGPELNITDHRQIGSSHKSIYHGRLRWGWGQYFMGTHPLYILAVGAYRMQEQPRVIGGALIIAGYLKGFLTGSRRYDYPGFRKSLHAWQMERLHLGHRLEVLPEV